MRKPSNIPFSIGTPDIRIYDTIDYDTTAKTPEPAAQTHFST